MACLQGSARLGRGLLDGVSTVLAAWLFAEGLPGPSSAAMRLMVGNRAKRPWCGADMEMGPCAAPFSAQTAWRRLPAVLRLPLRRPVLPGQSLLAVGYPTACGRAAPRGPAMSRL